MAEAAELLGMEFRRTAVLCPQWLEALSASEDLTSTPMGEANAAGQSELDVCNQQDRSHTAAEADVAAISSESSIANGLAIVGMESST